jgi:hypothetical protein
MKQLFLICALLFSLKSFPQGITGCQNGTWVCGTTTFTIGLDQGYAFTSSLSVSNPNTNPQAINNGCSQADGPYSYWFFFKVINTGTLGFSFGDTSTAFPQVGFYDWNLWSYSPTTCSDIYANIHPPLSCNWNNAASGGTGMGLIPPGGDPGNFQPGISVNAGDSFALLFSNYSAVNYSVTLLSTGTASIGCGGIITGIGNNNLSEEVKIFPNPVKNKITISFAFPAERSICLLSVDGKKIIEEKISERSLPLHLSQLEQGVYILIIEDGSGRKMSRRIIKD